MSYNRDNGSINEEMISAFLADCVSRVENASESDIQAMDTIKKLFKKNVPFARRKYVAAYLVKQAALNSRGRFGKNDRSDRFNRNDRRSERFEKTDSRAERTSRNEYSRSEKSAENTEERTERAPRVKIDDSLATTIFIGIGRNRRVYPRDLVGLLVSVAGLDRERIGDIRVLANYSFVQLYTEDCEKALAALNGYDYRGRKLTASYSRLKGEGEEDSVNAEASSAESAGNTVTEAVSDARDEGINNDPIPANVTNESSGVTPVESEEAKIAAAQSAYAASVAVEQKPYAETTDDGQVKSHFGDGAAY